MTSQEFSTVASNLPDTPGVYLFKDAAGAVLYVGKATSLRDRVRSYFSTDLIETRGQKLVDMVILATAIDHVPTDSVLEALILEANLIKYHQPKYNTDEKDNSSWNYVAITNEDFPKVLVMRGRTLMAEKQSDFKYIFGPFPLGGQLKEAMKIIRRIFPYRDTKCVPAPEQIAAGKTPRPCFNRQISLCPGVCSGEITQEEYADQIEHIRLFFEGKKKELVAGLEKEMRNYAATEEFEKADATKRLIFALTHIQDIALLKRQDKLGDLPGGSFGESGGRVFRIEAYDVAHSSGKQMVGVMVVLENGEPAKREYRKFRIRQPVGGDTAALSEILRRRFGHFEWPLPNLIVVDGGQAQLNSAQKIITDRGFAIQLVAVVKDEHHKPREILAEKAVMDQCGPAILLANAEAHRFAITYHRRRRDKLIP